MMMMMMMMMMIDFYRRRKTVVAMTGDGVNDAPGALSHSPLPPSLPHLSSPDF